MGSKQKYSVLNDSFAEENFQRKQVLSKSFVYKVDDKKTNVSFP